MQLSNVLSLDCTKSAVLCSSKNKVLEMICEIASEHCGQDISSLFSGMLAREKIGSTGIGNGIAIPHTRMSSSEEAVAVLIQCQEPIGFNAIDNRPVDILFALLVPEKKCKEHLKTLACIAERLNDKRVLRKLRKARSDKELFSVMINQSEGNH